MWNWKNKYNPFVIDCMHLIDIQILQFKTLAKYIMVFCIFIAINTEKYE